MDATDLSFVLFVSPLATPGLLLGLSLLLPIAFYFAQEIWKYRGYRDIAKDIRELARCLQWADVRRENGDLVVCGLSDQSPVTIRFSNEDFAPGVHVRLSARCDLSLSVFPKAEPGPGRVAIASRDRKFNARCAIRTDHPLEAKMLLASRNCLAELRRLCCSRRTLLALQPGAIELSESLIPHAPARHLLPRIQSAAVLAEMAAAMPGAHRIRIEPLPPRRLSPFVKLYAGLIALAASLAFSSTEHANLVPAVPNEASSEFNQVLQTAAFRGWRLAERDDFDLRFANWVRSSGAEPAARIRLKTDDPEVNADVYLLRANDESKRVAVFVDGSLIYDSRFIHLAGIARVPRDAITHIRWVEQAEPRDMPLGDGLLLAQDATDLRSGTVLFVRDRRVYAGTAVDYEEIMKR